MTEATSMTGVTNGMAGGAFDINQGLAACIGPKDPSNQKKYPKNSVSAKLSEIARQFPKSNS